MRRRARIDGNQEEIAQALEKAGAVVERKLARVGCGVPDLLVYCHNRLHVLEVKMPGEKLTPQERFWHLCFPCAVVVHNSEEALKAIGIKIIKQKLKGLEK